ncbi:MAG: DUF1275 domain-containing protein [Nitrospinae bacterium]|nr:DUF1275 domain-containing protein [Nitrospinota bacterium]
MAEQKVEVFTGVNIVGFFLIALAGWIDVVGVKWFFKERSAFMTGRASNIGMNFSVGNPSEGWVIIMIVVAFIIGAAIGTKLTKAFGLSGGLTFTAALVIIAAWMLGPDAGRTILAILIPMAMGCQNASSSATPINRTTHLTGPATDIGTNLALGNWNLFVFWLLRWIGFPLGAYMALTSFTAETAPMALGVGGVGVLLVAIIQKVTVDIPLK